VVSLRDNPLFEKAQLYQLAEQLAALKKPTFTAWRKNSPALEGHSF
jgi:hypothetical protein